ncbi:Uma2 family endonuclease [Nonomuraea endophytica]|uniref:Uma2 family endonuclease n=1 Tax=Nonomuraea endophytica TaxID=714136 RepID=A0A7W8EEG9_9ACTN|nr:Uma2 family endonuclease [Nonomuraea endophytica]MBB5077680.1 Uma2 family endonuclease [Nonomuraea endophytica]
MTAEAVSIDMPEKPPSLPDWVFPPPEGFVAEDLDHIPDLPAHTELLDGSLVFVSPQASFHMRAVSLVEMNLRRLAPKHLRVRREMNVILGPTQRPEPDVSVIRAEAEQDPNQTFYKAGDVLLVVEVVSPESKDRDRDRKPTLYARAGIPYFWRVENAEGQMMVHVYALDQSTRSYTLAGIFHERLKVPVPFDIDIDLTEIDQL